jgi:hypothetical protein
MMAQQTNLGKRESSDTKLSFVVSSAKKNKFERQLKLEIGPALLNHPPDDIFSLCRVENWPEFAKFCKDQPKGCLWIGPNGQTLLHYICQNHPSVECVRLFMNLCPGSLMKQDDDGCIPLHFAMTNGASHEVLWFLIQNAPDSVKVENKWGYRAWDWVWERCHYELVTLQSGTLTPSVMIWKTNVWKTIDALVRAMVNEDTDSTRTLLHMLLDFDCPLSLAQAVLDEYPSMTRNRDKQGRVPVAYAAISQELPFSILMIRMLILTNHEALWEQDIDGRIALHSAIDSGKGWNLIARSMAKSAPGTMQLRDPITNLYPFMMISSSNCAVVDEVFEAISFAVETVY